MPIHIRSSFKVCSYDMLFRPRSRVSRTLPAMKRRPSLLNPGDQEVTTEQASRVPILNA